MGYCIWDMLVYSELGNGHKLGVKLPHGCSHVMEIFKKPRKNRMICAPDCRELPIESTLNLIFACFQANVVSHYYKMSTWSWIWWAKESLKPGHWLKLFEAPWCKRLRCMGFCHGFHTVSPHRWSTPRVGGPALRWVDPSRTMMFWAISLSISVPSGNLT